MSEDRALDALAWWVAARLDGGDVAAALAATRALEQAAGVAWPDEETCPAAVVARRFARAHRAALGQDGGIPSIPGDAAMASDAATGHAAATAAPTAAPPAPASPAEVSPR